MFRTFYQFYKFYHTDRTATEYEDTQSRLIYDGWKDYGKTNTIHAWCKKGSGPVRVGTGKNDRLNICMVQKQAAWDYNAQYFALLKK